VNRHDNRHGNRHSACLSAPQISNIVVSTVRLGEIAAGEHSVGAAPARSGPPRRTAKANNNVNARVARRNRKSEAGNLKTGTPRSTRRGRE
jgi:hypothetical protein